LASNDIPQFMHDKLSASIIARLTDHARAAWPLPRPSSRKAARASLACVAVTGSISASIAASSSSSRRLATGSRLPSITCRFDVPRGGEAADGSPRDRASEARGLRLVAQDRDQR
jgi:hypothetical protein